MITANTVRDGAPSASEDANTKPHGTHVAGIIAAHVNNALGEEGVLVWDGETVHYARAYVIEPVDTTGAGDVFHAGFIYGLLQGWPMQKQLEFACAAAALNCLGVGARGGIKAVKSIVQLMATGTQHAAAFEVGRTGEPG